MTKRFKHSGTFGDLIYSLPIMKYLGGGEFYLHLEQINWIGQHYYGSQPNPVHQGRMNIQDYEFMKEFMLEQDYITGFEILNNSVEITHNLDRFRPLFVGHPGNYVDIYSTAFNITDPEIQTQLRNQPWLKIKNTKRIDNRSIIINRTPRWLPQTVNPKWQTWSQQNWSQQAAFIGLPQEYALFKQQIGWDIPYYACKNMREMAEIIQGADLFVGNQSLALSLAIGLGKQTWCEQRQDLPQNRNECYFKDNPNINYF